MAVITPQPLGAIAGTDLTFAAASAGGDRIAPGPNVYLVVKNGSAASINVTLDATGVAFNSQAIPDTVVAVPAGAEKLIPIVRAYASSVDGLAGITYSATATVTVAAIAV